MAPSFCNFFKSLQFIDLIAIYPVSILADSYRFSSILQQSLTPFLTTAQNNGEEPPSHPTLVSFYWYYRWRREGRTEGAAGSAPLRSLTAMLRFTANATPKGFLGASGQTSPCLSSGSLARLCAIALSQPKSRPFSSQFPAQKRTPPKRRKTAKPKK